MTVLCSLCKRWLMEHLCCCRFLNITAYGINISKQSSTGLSPFFLMYLRQPSGADTVDREIHPSTSEALLSQQDSGGAHLGLSTEAVIRATEQRDQVEATVRERLKSARQKQKDEYDARKRRGKVVVDVSVGAKVLVRNARKTTRKGGRLQPEFLGPYTVVKKTSAGHVTLRNAKGE